MKVHLILHDGPKGSRFAREAPFGDAELGVLPRVDESLVILLDGGRPAMRLRVMDVRWPIVLEHDVYVPDDVPTVVLLAYGEPVV